MKPLIIGTLLFLFWSSLATWYYVCHVNNYCEGPDTELAAIEEAEPSTIASPVVEEEPLSLPESTLIQYTYNSDKINPGEALEKFLADSKAYLEKNLGATVEITGYTCSIGTSVYNMDLGMRRAESAATYLTNKGLPGDRIITLSAGEEKPIADNNSKAGREKNRRSELTVKN